MKTSRFLLPLTFALAAGGCWTAVSPKATTPPTSTKTPSGAAAPNLLAQLHWLDHASFRLDGPPVIYFDPIVSKDAWPRADVILISHDHSDHYVLDVVKSLSTAKTVIIANADIAARLKGVSGMPADIRALKPGENTTVGAAGIEAVPAYNVNKTFHPKGAGHLGFVVTLGGERLYFAGDTDRIPEMAGIRCDVALLPIGGKYTMDANEAALAAADIQPRVVVPMHNRETDPAGFSRLCACVVAVLKPEK